MGYLQINLEQPEFVISRSKRNGEQLFVKSNGLDHTTIWMLQIVGGHMIIFTCLARTNDVYQALANMNEHAIKGDFEWVREK